MLIKDYVDLMKRFEESKAQDLMSEQMSKEKDKFEGDFVTLNCEIQQLRSDNETLLDELRIREDNLKLMDKEIQEKAALIQLLEERIKHMNA